MSEHTSSYETYDAPSMTPPPPAAPSGTPAGRRTGWHPVNTGHLVMGVAFIGLVVVWALLTSDTLQLEDARWILPLPWLVGGAFGIVASITRGRHHEEAYRQSDTMQEWQ